MGLGRGGSGVVRERGEEGRSWVLMAFMGSGIGFVLGTEGLNGIMKR